ncbi:uncharacterized protein Z518_06543 [Rhinocladiella mackenziei CBS 650.93]|uniref:FAD-binding FR-type domain-containing protein n=1 Tax=Rhinocladiella mackenziei CBS 650.93 TaxID=1442369 RepID=A0A0D2GXV0_9EURO|nr:uncharacterized protein Z518_06543 [Rhinocladiella mackenziei CBS 650.93]KIX02993.1 hypothetical protein Z518_06543 [Rhinocladiella mackenziei CBS 650.93]
MDQVLPSGFPEVLRLSLKSSTSLLSALEEPPHPPDSDHIRKIIAAVLWHRKFVLTYYIVIATVVASSCSHGTYRRTTRWQKRRRINIAKIDSTTPETTPSSSSSTLRGTTTPPQKDDGLGQGETTFLLVQNELPSLQRPSLLNRLRAFLMYQPRPIPAWTSSSNVLPNNGTSLLTLFFLAVNLFYLLYRVPLSMTWIFILADRAGLLFVVNLPVLYLLAAKTSQPIKLLTGWSYEGLNLFHRRLGEWMTVFAVIHMLGMLAVWYTIFRPLDFSLIRYITSQVVFLGIVAVLSYYIIYITSIGWFRQRHYETFLGLHISFQAAALAFLFFHYPTAKPYVMATFAIWAIDRLLWRITLSSRRFIATLEVAPDGHTVLIHCTVDLQRKRFGIRSHLRHGWLPGQHVFLTIPSMGFKYRFQAHPFTIASPAPPKSTTLRSWPLQLVIRSINGFSLDLLKYARHHQHCDVILDGPHGGIEALEAAHHADRVCFVAGGSGIAVTYPLSWDIRVKQHMQADAIVSARAVYQDRLKSVPSIVDCSSLVNAAKYSHFWIRQDLRHGKWVSMHPRAIAVEHDTRDDLFLVDGAGAHGQEEVACLVTQTFDTRSPGPSGGRPDMKSEIWNWVTSVPTARSTSSTALGGRSVDSDTGSISTGQGMTLPASLLKDSTNQTGQKDKICIIVSGPDGLVRDVRNVAAELVQQGWDLEVWVEKFGW